MPLIVVVAVSPPMYADVIDPPGANRSTHGPKFENDARVSDSSVAPTVIASGVDAGLLPHAS